MSLGRSLLLVTIPLGLAALALVVWTALSLVRTVRGAVVARLPLVAEQRVHLETSGRLALSVEFSRAFRNVAGLTFSILHADRGIYVPLQRVVFRTKVWSFTRTRVELFTLLIPTPGTYVIRATGLVETDADDVIVLARRFGGMLVLHVLVLVALGGAFIGAMVVTGLVIAASGG